MNTILWVFVALAFGLMAFVSIQDDVPEELSFLKFNTAAIVDPAAVTQPTVRQLAGWTVTQQGPALEASRRMSGELKVNGAAYDVPTVGILCNAGTLDARLDTRMPTTGVKTTRVEIDGKVSEWPKGTGMSIFPPDAAAFSRYLAQRATVSFSLSFRDLGKQTVLLETGHLDQVLQGFPASCR